MITLAQLATHLREQSYLMPSLLRAEHAHNAHTIAAEAAEYLGHELPEWPALAPSTVAEKTRLGYVGQVSATDPGLRTGEMQRSIEGAADFDGFTIGSREKKMLYFEIGTSRQPPRPALALALSRNVDHLGYRYGLLAMRALTPGATNVRIG